RLGKRCVVYHASAAGIDEDRSRRQRSKQRAIHQSSCCRGVWNHRDEVVQIRSERGAMVAMKIDVYVGAAFARASVALYPHLKVLRRPRQRRADRADAEQADRFPAKSSGRRWIPPALLLRRVLVENQPLVREEI